MTRHAFAFAAGVLLTLASSAEPNPAAGAASSAASGAPPALKTCHVKAVDAFLKARANGYRFEGERANGEGECFVDDGFPAFIGRAGTQALECRFRGFAGPALKGDWRFTAASFTGDPFVLMSPGGESAPQPAGAAPLEFVLQVPATGDRKVVLSSVSMSGSDCGQWREAF